MTREKALLELQTMYRQEGMRNVRDLQETIERETRMDALEVAIAEIGEAIKAENDAKNMAEMISKLPVTICPTDEMKIEINTTPLFETVNAVKERLHNNPNMNPVYRIFKAMNADSEPLTVKVKYFADIDPIEELPQGSWIDLRCARDVHIPADGYAQIPLGVAMELPDGYEAVVAPRSSTFRKYGVILVNSIGVIDPDYRGDGDQWHFLAYAVKDAVIPKNDRICQFRILPRQPKMEFLKVEHLRNPDRGGIGSTGRT